MPVARFERLETQDRGRRPDPAQGAGRRARVLRRDLPPQRVRRPRHRRGDGPGQPFALEVRDRPRDALPDRRRRGEAHPLRPRLDRRRRRRPAARVADLRRVGGLRDRRGERADGLLPRRLRARLLRGVRTRRRLLQAVELLLRRARARDQVQRPRVGIEWPIPRRRSSPRPSADTDAPTLQEVEADLPFRYGAAARLPISRGLRELESSETGDPDGSTRSCRVGRAVRSSPRDPRGAWPRRRGLAVVQGPSCGKQVVAHVDALESYGRRLAAGLARRSQSTMPPSRRRPCVGGPDVVARGACGRSASRAATSSAGGLPHDRPSVSRSRPAHVALGYTLTAATWMRRYMAGTGAAARSRADEVVGGARSGGPASVRNTTAPPACTVFTSAPRPRADERRRDGAPCSPIGAVAALHASRAACGRRPRSGSAGIHVRGRESAPRPLAGPEELQHRVRSSPSTRRRTRSRPAPRAGRPREPSCAARARRLRWAGGERRPVRRAWHPDVS